MVLARVNDSEVRNLEDVIATMGEATEAALSFHPHIIPATMADRRGEGMQITLRQGADPKPWGIFLDPDTMKLVDPPSGT